MKDTGFSDAVLVEMLDRFDRLGRGEFDVADAGFAATVEAVQRWRLLLRRAEG